MKLKKELPLLLLVAVPFVYLALIWKELPSEVPLHWNIQGEIDRYGSKAELWAITAVTSGLIYLIFLLVPIIDPKRKIHEMGAKYTQLKFAMVAIMSALGVVLLHMIKKGNDDSLSLVFIVIGLLISVLGNFMKTVRPNYFIGIRTPWTLENPAIWDKTHHLAGKLWFAGGLLMILLVFFLKDASYIIVFTGLILMIALIPIAYSFILFRRMGEKGKPDLN